MKTIKIITSVTLTEEYKVIRDKAIEEGFKSLNRYEFSQIWTDNQGNDITEEFYMEGDKKLHIILQNSWRKDQETIMQKYQSLKDDHGIQ